MNDEMAENIAAQLRRIADGIKALVEQCKKCDDGLTYTAILNMVSCYQGDNRSLFARIVYNNTDKHPREICKLLKAAGLLAKSTYWRDVKILRAMDK